MAEAILCPSCTTRYRLRPERLKPVTRRAKCLSCGGIFPVGDIVQRLLGLPDPNATAALQAQAPPDPEPEWSAQLEAPAGAPEPEWSALLEAPAGAPEPEWPAIPETPLPALSLGDLESVEPDPMEETQVSIPVPLPETKLEVAPEPAPAYVLPPPMSNLGDMEATASGYTSARDAIDKLFGSSQASAPPLKIHRESDAADLEASLSALDTTLGPSTPAAPSPVQEPAELTEDDLAAPSRSTMRLTQEHLQAIAAAAPAPAEPTVALRASDFQLPPMGQPETVPAPLAPRGFTAFNSPEPGAELLRLKIGEEIYAGLTMPQLITWVEEGRILENHLVARQHSENWLEAHKVPGLRPVFERLRRERSGAVPTLDSDLGDNAPKKSLFGGLFGKN